MLFFDIFKYINEKTQNEEDIFSDFLKNYPPEENLIKPSEHIIDAARSVKVPEEIINFWTSYGFGNYGDGIIKMIDPEKYMSGFYTWLGKEDYSRIPIFMTGFGDIFYYRNLGNGEYDISLLDIHYRDISVCTYTLEDFLKNYIVSENVKKEILRKELFEEAKKSKGILKKEEIYFFAPALIAGGAEELKYVDKGDAAVHHEILFQWGT